MAWPSTGPGHNVNRSVIFPFGLSLGMIDYSYYSLAPVNMVQLLCKLITFMGINCTLFLHVAPCSFDNLFLDVAKYV